MTTGRAKIAVVDDDSAIRRALDRLLRGAGFDVETFASGEDYLARGEDYCPRCLVLDISLGGMSGLEVREALVRSGSRVPVVFITAHDDAQTRRALQEAGDVPCLRKPFDEELLFEAIAAVTGGPPLQ